MRSPPCMRKLRWPSQWPGVSQTSSANWPTCTWSPSRTSAVDGAGRQVVVRRVEAGGLGDVQRHGPLVAGADDRGGDVGGDDLGVEPRAGFGGGADMVAVIVGEDELAHAAGVEAVVAHVLEHQVEVAGQPQAGVDERQLAVAAVEDVDMAVERAGDAKAKAAAADHIDITREFHGVLLSQWQEQAV